MKLDRFRAYENVILAYEKSNFKHVKMKRNFHSHPLMLYEFTFNNCYNNELADLLFVYNTTLNHEKCELCEITRIFAASQHEIS